MGCNCKGAAASYGTKVQPREIDQAAIDRQALERMPRRPARRAQTDPAQVRRVMSR